MGDTPSFPHPKDEYVADLVARLAHRGQTDKSGADYITHPRRVAEIVRSWGYSHPHTTAALLHDTVEDTELSLGDLEAVFGGEVVRAVDNLTRRRGEGPEAYYERVRNGDSFWLVNEISLVVKHADITDNTSPERIGKLDATTQRRLTKKYAKAREHLGPRPTR